MYEPGWRLWQQEYERRIRKAVFGHYGTVCACCGATELLCIDHVNGGGSAHRVALFGYSYCGGLQFWRWLIAQGFPDGYQTLCRPCNRSKAEGPHCLLHTPQVGPVVLAKTCPSCGRHRPIGKFHRDARRQGKRNRICIDCPPPRR